MWWNGKGNGAVVTVPVRTRKHSGFELVLRNFVTVDDRKALLTVAFCIVAPTSTCTANVIRTDFTSNSSERSSEWQ